MLKKLINVKISKISSSFCSINRFNNNNNNNNNNCFANIKSSVINNKQIKKNI